MFSIKLDADRDTKATTEKNRYVVVSDNDEY